MKNLVDCVICSPPYSECGSGNNMKSGAVDCEAWSDGKPRKMGPSMMHADGYGSTTGQLGSMKSGTLPKDDTMNDKETPRDCVFHEWEDCYSDSWKSLIVEAAFAH